MELRRLGACDLQVPVLSLGTGTFGGRGLFSAFGTNGPKEARRLVDICLEAGVTMFDTADVYSLGAAEELLGSAVKGRRDQVILSTKSGAPVGGSGGASDGVHSRLVTACENSLRRLGTDYVDLYQLHFFDASLPLDEVLSALDHLVRSGKVRHVGASNFCGWQLMKSLDSAERHGYSRYVSQQVYYSLVGRDYEWELMPLGLDQNLGALVWSPLGWARLTGKVRRGQPLPEQGRLPRTAAFGPHVDDEHLFRVVEVLDEISEETGRTVPQIAINWLIQRPTVSSVIIGARDETQLRDNLGAAGWSLTCDQVARLDAASAKPTPYPYFHYTREEFPVQEPEPATT
ncbi:aldo/keto reductase [Streptomyces caelestis]|jgi:aryl-alcohol dehydrogenase-like predicted oxidoreductase|uniref:Aryl-alcohol dehydrogenase-like predicted oxidoreductase n=1 Tax=Streptomyces caelestis TaxID=36816 RepID=A0A7W9GY29_9ACTN|nr:aldo/keto reductase [Streptomyces caelestis]MBB5792197.1 aryl-alcohol dehydrogenase-like predicted oxidoreductase [Streptomyces caelestis]GGW83141.1 oxidoreductase [Streptomyces caelestis]